MKKNFKTRGKRIVRCKRPLPEIELPPKYEEIADKAFLGDAVIKKIVIPENIRVISFGAFESASELESVSFSESATVELKPRGFMRCSKLEHIDNMSVIVSYGDRAFMDCSNLEDCNINRHLGNFGKRCFEGCKKITDVQFPSGHDEVPIRTFCGCESLVNVEFRRNQQNENEVKKIGKKAFFSCISLGKIYLPDTLETIGESAFEDCYSIPKIRFGGNLKKIEKNAFRNCLYLNTLEFSRISGKKIKIENGAFSGCVELRKIVINDGSWTISPSAFNKCKLNADNPLSIVCYNEETAADLNRCLKTLIKKELVNIVLKEAPLETAEMTAV